MSENHASLIQKLSKNLRQTKLKPLLNELQGGATVLDVGVWCKMPEPHPAENWLAKQDPGAGQLIALGVEDMRAFHVKYPHVLCVQGDGRALPFRDGAIDVAIANAVLEHVATDGQPSFVQEMARVVQQEALLAVPDRWCPLEVHSRLPVIHWLPFWRRAFRMMGKTFWALPENLASIFTADSLAALLKNSTPSGNWQVDRQRYYGIPVSLVARLRKSSADR